MLTKTEMVEAIQNKIVTEDNFKALEILFENMKTVTKVFNTFKKIKNDDKKITKKDIAKLIECESKELEFIIFSDFEKNLIGLAYFLTTLLKQENTVKQHIIFDGDKFSKEERKYTYQFLNKGIKYPCRVNGVKTTSDLKYLVLPHLHRYHDAQTEGRMWLICKKQDTEKAITDLTNLLIKLNPIRNQCVVISTSGAYYIDDFKPKFDFDDVILTDNIKQECQLISKMFEQYNTFKESGISTKRGVLLSGIPGTGKTTTVNALIKKILNAGGTVFKLIQEKTTQQRLDPTSSIFDMAKKYHPSLVILEDFDLIGGSRGIGNQKEISNELLDLLENKNEDTVVIATTNIKEGLDVAAIRAGRIDKTYTLDYPDMDMKKKLIEVHKKYYNIDMDVFTILNGFLENYITGATISSLMLTAVQKAKTENRNIEEQDLNWAIEGIKLENYKQSVI
jgi:SpoVK/Ycf46/Vps4 family AAA+-type ATPase